MSLVTSQQDLERKTENAIAARFKQHPLLAKIRMRNTSEDSAKVNQDLIISAKRGEGNPPFSGVYNLEVSCTYSSKHRKTIDTLPNFLRVCGAIEDVLSVHTYELANQLTRTIPDYHCYEIAVVGKDTPPEGNKHVCAYQLSVIAMPISYDSGVALNEDPNQH